jgi:hypothetical protein
MKRIIVPAISILLALMLVSSTSAQNPGTGSTNFTVMNLDASEAAQVVASYVNQSGVVDSTVSETIDPRSSQGFPAASSGLPDSWIGSAVVAADQEIVAFVQALWQNGSSTDGKTAGAYNGFTQGVNTLYFPSLAARSGKQHSRLSVQSAEGASTSETINITIRYYDRNGNLNKTVNDTLYKGAQKTYNLLDEGLPTTSPPGDGWLGSAVVESTSPIAGAVTMHWSQYASAYSAVTGGATEAYLPSATRRLPGGTWEQFTAVVVQNLDLTTDANVTVYWYDRVGSQLHSFTDTIPANSSHGYNTRYTNSDVPNHSALHSALGDNWNGSVVINSTNGTDIVAIANLQWTESSGPGNSASSYYSEPGGYSEVFVPATFRRSTASGWDQYTGLVVQNVGSSNCNNFSVEWRNRSGDLLLSYTDSLAPNIAHGYNTRFGSSGSDIPSGADVGDLGSDFRGSVYINASGCELVALHNTLWPGWTAATTYNAFGQ